MTESGSVVPQLSPTLCNPMDCTPSGSSVHGILQATMLKWVAIGFSRGSSWPRDQLGSLTLQADALLSEPPGKPTCMIVFSLSLMSLSLIFFFLCHPVIDPGYSTNLFSIYYLFSCGLSTIESIHWLPCFCFCGFLAFWVFNGFLFFLILCWNF